MSTVDATNLADDGRRYLLSTAVWPDTAPRSITVYGTADLTRRMAEATRLGVDVSFRQLDEREIR